MGYPPSRPGWGTPPHHKDMTRVPSRPPWDGVPTIKTWLGYPHPMMGYPLLTRQSSIASTCYAAGSMPLAFTQDFLVILGNVCVFIIPLGGGGTLSQVWVGVVTLSQVWMVGGVPGVPPWPGLDGGGGTWGTPHHDWMGYPPPPA